MEGFQSDSVATSSDHAGNLYVLGAVHGLPGYVMRTKKSDTLFVTVLLSVVMMMIEVVAGPCAAAPGPASGPRPPCFCHRAGALVKVYKVLKTRF